VGESESKALVPFAGGPMDVAAAYAASLPAIVAAAGPKARKRLLGFFAADIRNPKTRHAYAFATDRFTAWCEARGISLADEVLVARE
jgi:hypothetical protein